MKKITKHIISLSTIAVFLIIALATGEDKEEKSDRSSVDFEQIGYWKGESKQRMFTFSIESTEQINSGSIPEELWSAIQEHGQKQMNTSGRNTMSYYYLNKQNTPDITTYSTYDGAYEKAMCAKPIAEVYIQFNGEKGINKNPKDESINCR
ncbi:MAG: hypothetical protein U5L96_09245 [Owenweeksia sp.]|nr:hypothetical protein [Owenweeksia sp.]